MKLACADNGALWTGVGAPSSLGVSAPHVLGENAAVHRMEGTRGAGVDAQHAPQLLLPLLLILHDCRGRTNRSTSTNIYSRRFKVESYGQCFGAVTYSFETDPDPAF
jgi:hypothetical protein